MTTLSPPIRVGLIGLSGAPDHKYEGTKWAQTAHLLYINQSPHYELVALLNSSAESARAAKIKYNLPESVKTYGKPEELAADENVDMVVCCVRVDRHYATVYPSVLAGKTVFVEWPLEKNATIAREMATLAKKHGVKTIVGLQGSFAEPVRKVKELVDEGKIGKVLSSTLFAAMGNSGSTESKNVRYFLDRKIGGNTLNIHFWHCVECIVPVIGEFKIWSSYLINQHSKKDVLVSDSYMIESNRDVFQASVPNNVPDQHLFQGVTTKNIPFSLHRRGGTAFPGTPAVEWRIQGEKGEIRFTSSDYHIYMGHPSPITKIELFIEGEGVSDVQWGIKDEIDEMDLPSVGKGTARIYEAYRKGEWVPDWDWAVKRQEVVEEMWKRYDADVEAGLAI